MKTRAERLRAYIDAADGQPVVWGQSDCCAWPVRWAEQESGRKVAMPRYSSKSEALALVLKRGGLVNVAAVMDEAGFMRTEDPQLGDIGIIHLSERDVGVIFAPAAYAVWRAEPVGAAFIKPKTIVAAWSV